MHKRKGALVNSPALVSLKLCIFFRLFFVLFCSFISFFCLFYLFCPFYPFYILFRFFNSSLPFVILLYPYPHSFYSFPPFRILYSALFRYLIFPFHILLYSSAAFIFLSLVIISIPFPYLLYIPFCSLRCGCITSSMLSGFVFPLLTSIYSYSVVVIILQMCLFLYSLLPECLDALQHVPRAPYHLLIYFP